MARAGFAASLDPVHVPRPRSDVPSRGRDMSVGPNPSVRIFGRSLPRPVDFGHPREVDTQGGKPGTMRGDAPAIALPAHVGGGRPCELRDRGHAWKREILVILAIE